MWPFKSKDTPPPQKGELQTDLAALDITGGEIALMFEIPDENESRYWIVKDPETLREITDGTAQTDPPHFFTAVGKVSDPDPQMPELVWLLEGRALKDAYNLTSHAEFKQHMAERYLTALGPKAHRIEWFEPHLRGRSEIEALQERLWVEDDIFALAELPDTSEIQHDFTHAFDLRFPPADTPPAYQNGVLQKITRLLEAAFPGSADLYVQGRVYFAPLSEPATIAIREPKELNAADKPIVSAPPAPLFQPYVRLYCDEAFYDHAKRHAADLIPRTALLSEAYQDEVASIAKAAIANGTLPSTGGDIFLNEGPSWLAAQAGLYRPQDYPFRYFKWPT